MKKTLKFVPWAALLCAIGLLADSCKKETFSPGGQEAQGEPKQEKVTFWDVVGPLVAASDYTPDYEGKTFEPVIGTAVEGDEQTRIVKSNSPAAAASSFCDLVSMTGIDEHTANYTWTQEGIGTLTYTKSDGTTAWAEVKVDIPAIPHLSKIIYRSAAQSGDNGSFSYAAYYRFGDVISRLNSDTVREYWVCVRPAFGPEGKEDSHWMCVGSLPTENIWTYTSSHDKEYAFPTGLKTSKEHMQNFAELLFALCYPTEWSQNIQNYSTVGWFGPSGLPIFHDFSPNNVKYNNANFWNNVAVKWKEKGVDYLVMGKNLEGIAAELKGEGLHFLYKGYSWWTPTSNFATVYQAKFVNGNGEHSNMQTASPYTDQKVQMVYKNQPTKDIKEFDVRNKKSVSYLDFFGDGNPRYIVRYAIASDLASDGRTPAADQAIPGTEEVYRYYRDILPVTDVKKHSPERTMGTVVNDPQKHNYRDDFTGVGHYSLGSVLKDEKGHHWVVMNVAGRPGGLGLDNTCEANPIAELISFEGLEAADGYLYALPTFAQAVRAATYIRIQYGNGRNAFVDDDEGNRSLAMKLVKHICDHTHWNLLEMVQTTLGWGDARNLTQAFSVAYIDRDQIANKKQPLFRFLYPISMDNQNIPYFFWKHYPLAPDNTKISYSSSEFGNVPIMLQDIAKEEMVARYAPDFYAIQPLENGDGPRRPRDGAHGRAEIPSSYFYDSIRWKSHEAVDMWNEPVLMFRTDAVYDRGTEYSTITLGGRRLTLVAEIEDFINPADDDALADSFREAYIYKGANAKDWAGGQMQLDGTLFTIPNWRIAWEK